MTDREILLKQAEFAYQELLDSVKDVTQSQAWSVLPNLGAEEINTDGSIQGIVLHIAVCKYMYGSIGFKQSEIRWNHCATEVESFEPNWEAALTYLQSSQNYWMESWKDLKDFELMYPHFRGKEWSASRLIQMVTHHDSYHAGQINLLRYAVQSSSIRPPSVAEDIRLYCPDLPDW